MALAAAYLSIAFVVVGALAWDIARRHIGKVRDHELQQINVRIARIDGELMGTQAELAKTDEVIKTLALEWKQKFGEVDQKWTDLEAQLGAKLGGAIANLKPRGFGR